MYGANDSIVNMRAAQNSSSQRKRLLPIDELRAKIAQKQAEQNGPNQQQQQQKPTLSGAPRDSLQNLRAAMNRPPSFHRPPQPSFPEPKRRKVEEEQPVPLKETKIKIDESQNIEHYIETSPEELRVLWMSRDESQQVKDNVQLAIALLRRGICPEEDCVRGLEIHACPRRLEEKIERNHNYIELVLQQQNLLANVMGKVSDTILSRLCSAMSADDANEARDNAMRDAEEAFLIHASDRADVDQEKLAQLLKSGPMDDDDDAAEVVTASPSPLPEEEISNTITPVTSTA